MGRGDKKSKKGKIAIGSYGNTRRKKKRAAVVRQPAVAETAAAESVVAKPRKTARKKTEG